MAKRLPLSGPREPDEESFEAKMSRIVEPLAVAARRGQLRGFIQDVKSVAAERRATLHELRTALEKGDDQSALRLARVLTGLPDS